MYGLEASVSESVSRIIHYGNKSTHNMYRGWVGLDTLIFLRVYLIQCVIMVDAVEPKFKQHAISS